MNQFRRPSQLIGGTKSGSKNPAQFSNTPQPFNPVYSPDQRQFYNARANEYGNTIDIATAQDRANQSLPAVSRVQVDYTPFMFTGVPDVGGTILIPRNANRLNWYIINCGETVVTFSFGQISNNGAFPNWGFSLHTGVVAPFVNWFSEENGAVGINDIYVYPQAQGATINILGYEGVAILGSGN